MEIEEISDSVYEMTEDIEPSLVLQALVMTIMGTAGRCADPHRALLGVIAEMTDLIRFMEAPKGNKGRKPLSHDAWVRSAWAREGAVDEGAVDEVETLANWHPPRGKPQ